jgi:glycosyltransferase involved in cell wall biosynthesis
MTTIKKLSVVIPTLGGECLKETLNRLNSGSHIPNEILICIPEKIHINDDILELKNVNIIYTPVRSQVAQRAIGFQRAKYDYILQLDDDILVDYFCVENLLMNSQKLGTNVAISPILVDGKTGNSVYKIPRYPKFILTLYFWLMNGDHGYQPGKIDKAGSAIGVDPKTNRSQLIEVDWLPGGCVMHHRENLILDDFWKRTGKAYYEDLVHSYLIKKNGIKLYIDKKSICKIEVMKKTNTTINYFLKDLYSDYLARKYYMKKVGLLSLRMNLYYIFRILSYLYCRILKIN